MTSLTAILKKGFNTIAPESYRRPLLKAGTSICSESIGHKDVPRFPGDTLYSTEGAGMRLHIERISYGRYKLNNPANPASAVFEHNNISGLPHYEVRVTGISLKDNYQSTYVPTDSLIHFPVQVIEERFLTSSQALKNMGY